MVLSALMPLPGRLRDKSLNRLNRVRILCAVILLAGALAAQTNAPAPPARPVNPARALLNKHCAGCHGETLQGARGPSLVTQKWMYGGDEASLIASIRDGRAAGDMPAFKDVLTAPEIRTLALTIRDGALRAQGRPATTASVPVNGVFRSELHSFKMETVADGLVTPWGLDFLPDGRIVLSERPGRIRIIEKGRLLEPVVGTPQSWQRQDGGYFDIAVHPDYSTNGWIYLGYSDAGPNNTSFSEPGPSNTSSTKVVRGRIKDNTWVDQQTIFQAAPEYYTPSNTHYGLRFVFDRNKHLYFSIGDRSRAEMAQDISHPIGKIFRVMDDGKVPPDNPFAKDPKALGIVWSYGHRNPQGLAFHPVTGKLWETEHGPRGGDEVNVIYPGHNYGWPVVTFGIRDNGQIGNGTTTEKTSMPGMDDPAWHWEPSPGISPLAFYTGNQFPAWKNQLFVGAMAHEQLKRLTIDGDKVVKEEIVFRGLGRIRDIVTGPDGNLYLALHEGGPNVSANTPGKIVRLVP
jgi:aldose sugar dehydrogenase